MPHKRPFKQLNKLTNNSGDLPSFVLVGRPNVGKSTLFNRLVGRRRAIVHNRPGVTRDRIEARSSWEIGGGTFSALMIDTGGLGGERFAKDIEAQVKTSVERASAILFIFDAQTGLTSQDQFVLEIIRAMAKIPIIGVVNKVDAEAHESRLFDFYATGLESLLTVSAEHGRGVEDLKEALFSVAGGASEKPGTDQTTDKTDTKTTRPPLVAIVGRPNVGKSTLVNAILREHRMITSSMPGTTIDTVDSEAVLSGKEFTLLDTAGIRKQAKTEQGVEVLSVIQTKKALERCDVAVLLLDGEAGITEQDAKIGGLIEEAGCSVILAVNKWDIQSRQGRVTKTRAAEQIRGSLAYLKYAPVMFMSALEGKLFRTDKVAPKVNEGFGALGDLITEILKQRKTRITTNEFTKWVRDVVLVNNPKNAKFYLCHQTTNNPPTFVCHVSDPAKIHFSLGRHLINSLRDQWGFIGTPIRMKFVKGGSGRSASGAKGPR